jgi:beta-xylosidase
LELAQADKFADITLGIQHCPLCLLYYNAACEGCIIAETTHKEACVDTPYEEALDAIKNIYYWQDVYTKSQEYYDSYQADKREAIKAIEAEIAFLTSLLGTKT